MSFVSEAHVRKQDMFSAWLVTLVTCDIQNLPWVYIPFWNDKGASKNLGLWQFVWIAMRGGKCQWWETQKRPPSSLTVHVFPRYLRVWPTGVVSQNFFKSRIGELGRPIMIFVFPLMFHVMCKATVIEVQRLIKEGLEKSRHRRHLFHILWLHGGRSVTLC